MLNISLFLSLSVSLSLSLSLSPSLSLRPPRVQCSMLLRQVTMQDVALAESMMDAARVAVDKVELDGSDKFVTLARHDARVLMHLVKKGKHGFEEIEYSTLYDVMNKFTADCKALGKDVAPWVIKQAAKKVIGKKSAEKPCAAAEPDGANDADDADEKHALQTLKDMKSPVLQMERRGFKAGVVIRRKAVEGDRAGEDLFIITDVRATSVHLQPAMKMYVPSGATVEQASVYTWCVLLLLL